MDIRDHKGVLQGRITQQGSDTVLRDSKGNLQGRISGGVAYDHRSVKLGNAAMLGTLIGNKK
jgi:hypothetical protein